MEYKPKGRKLRLSRINDAHDGVFERNDNVVAPERKPETQSRRRNSN